MHLRGTACAGLLCALLMAAWGRTPAPNQETTACTFEGGGQVSVRYDAAPAHGDRPPEGRVWSPGDSPIYLFTSTTLKAGEAKIPTGAYSLYVIPEKNQWLLVVNKDVTDKKYDPEEDLVRVPMDLGTVDETVKNVSLVFGHIAPKQCNLRLYYGKTGAWAVFSEP